MDGTENEHPDVEVKGFPTIIFYPAGKDAKPITFDGGDRSLKVRFCFNCGVSCVNPAVCLGVFRSVLGLKSANYAYF
jgi:hypothetical protein